MNPDYLNPVDDTVFAHAMLQSDQTLGYQIKIHSQQNGLPDLDGIRLAIIAVEEGRGAIDNEETGIGVGEIRKQLYQLYPGSWATDRKSVV